MYPSGNKIVNTLFVLRSPRKNKSHEKSMFKTELFKREIQKQALLEVYSGKNIVTNSQMKSGQAASVLTGFRIPYHSVSYMKLCNRLFFLFHSILVLFLLTKEKLLRSRCAPSFCTRSS